MDCPLHWRHVSTCYRVICAYCANVTMRRTLGDTRCTPRHLVNKVSVRQFSAENKQESAEFYSQHLPMHSHDVIYERSNQNLPSRWVLAWSMQKWILWVIIVRRAGLLWSQQDFEWRWSVPLFKCLTVLEFSFILFDLCLLITFFNFIMNYVPIVLFWIFTYHKIWILSIMFCFIWSYWIIYFLACLELSWRVVS